MNLNVLYRFKKLLLVIAAFSCMELHAQPTKLIESVLFQLNLNIEDCYTDLIVEKKMPDNPKESVVVIPKIVYMDETMFSLDSYIVIVNNVSGTIKSKYFESTATNGWESDAIRLTEISIDTAPYFLKDKARAFGIRLRFRNNSKPNPYACEKLSLFIPNGNKLDIVLKNLEVDHYSGEWDTQCAGEFEEKQSMVIVLPQQTNEYFDLRIKTKVSVIRSAPNPKKECVDKITTREEIKVLKFTKGKYQ